MPVFGSNAAQHSANVVTLAGRMAMNLQAQDEKPRSSWHTTLKSKVGLRHFQQYCSKINSVESVRAFHLKPTYDTLATVYLLGQKLSLFPWISSFSLVLFVTGVSLALKLHIKQHV
jgi:hypothetical protein